MSDGFSTGGFCEDLIEYYPLSNFIPGIPGDNGLLLLFSGILNFLMSIVTIVWIKNNEFQAQTEDGKEEAVQSVIFPVFVKVLWLSAIINLYAGVVTAIIPQHPAGENHSIETYIYAFNYAMMRTLQHCVVEGIAFLLMQKGCGKYATKRALISTVVWGAITFTIMFLSFSVGGWIYDWMNEFWNIVLLLFYAIVWLAPQKHLFRRPAAIKYCQFWTIFRLIIVLINVLFMFTDTDSIAACGFIFINLLFLAIAQPVICYWTLLQDSRWWQGLDIYQGRRNASNEGIRSPLMGTEFDIFSAQSLALTMDQIRVKGSVKMLNFASLRLDTKKMLGSGSFSKVYRGAYRGKECAIKLIYTSDLTADIIMRVAAEASILSSIRHPNIVHILGLSVLPPSVCLILELCSFGSLSDVIRGYGFDWNTTHRSPLALSRTDGIYLALGCARGLAAVHSFDASICHRDVKSFNFLVDSQFNVKIADLELGIASRLNISTNSGVGATLASGERTSITDNELLLDRNTEQYESFVVENLLANWLAPEVLKERKFYQSSDIYALGTVIWEIISKQLPFANDRQPQIRTKILEGYRHPIPAEYLNTPIAHLITSCWNENYKLRPFGSEIVLQLEHILDNECYSYVKDIEGGGALLKTNTLVEFYEVNYRKSSSRLSDFMSANRRSQHQIGTTPTKFEAPRTSWFSYLGGAYSSLRSSDIEDNNDSNGNSFDQTPTKTSESSLDVDLLVGQSNSADTNSGSFDNDIDTQSSFSSRSFASQYSTSASIGGAQYYTPAKSNNNVYNSNNINNNNNGGSGKKRSHSGGTAVSESAAGGYYPQLPKLALDAIGIVKEENYWRSLEKHGGCWAIMTTQAPHVVMHATTAWYHLFKINPLTGTNSKLESLVSLVESFNMENKLKDAENNTLLPGTTASKPYNSSNHNVNEPNNFAENNKILKRIMRQIKESQQVHGVLSFHIRSNTNYQTAGSGRELSGANNSNGYNMMCTVHAYPVYSINQYSYSDTDIYSTSSSHSLHHQGSSNSSKSGTYRKQSSESAPIYYAMLFNELKEQTPHTPEHGERGVNAERTGSFNSFTELFGKIGGSGNSGSNISDPISPRSPRTTANKKSSLAAQLKSLLPSLGGGNSSSNNSYAGSYNDKYTESLINDATSSKTAGTDNSLLGKYFSHPTLSSTQTPFSNFANHNSAGGSFSSAVDGGFSDDVDEIRPHSFA